MDVWTQQKILTLFSRMGLMGGWGGIDQEDHQSTLVLPFISISSTIFSDFLAKMFHELRQLNILLETTAARQKKHKGDFFQFCNVGIT